MTRKPREPLKILFLDDDPERHEVMRRLERKSGHRVIGVYTLCDFKHVLRNDGPFDIISLDHDLNDFDARSYAHDGSEATGLDACGLLVSESLREKLPPRITIHSANPRGARAMRDFLEQRGIETELMPFWY